MKQYFILKNNQRLGPFPLEQLLSNGLTPDTKIWWPGMANWLKASEVSEVAALFTQQPQYQAAQPSMGNYAASPQYQAPQPPMGNYSASTEILPIFKTISEAVTIGFKNFFPLFITTILYFLTIWIPYLNVGTTIAMLTVPAELSKGKVINPGFIFKSVYRKHIGRFFLFVGFFCMAMFPAMLLLIVPAIVLIFAWSIAAYLLLDKNLNPIKALEKSNEYTYGYKLKIFGIKFVFGFILSIIFSILVALLLDHFPKVFIFFSTILTLMISPISLSLDGVIYRELLKRTDVTLD